MVATCEKLLFSMLFFLNHFIGEFRCNQPDSQQIKLGTLPIFNSATEAISALDDNANEKCKQSIEKEEVVNGLSYFAKHGASEFGIDALAIVHVTDKEYMRRHHFKGCLNLILYRHGNPIVYGGDNLQMNFDRLDVEHWIRTNLNSYVKNLSDESFEHLTQASTGATTGDWVIWFHKQSCLHLRPVWEALASRLQYSKIVGEVDTDANPKLVKRFKLSDCQTIIIFKHGSMYTYTGDSLSLNALSNFAEVSYKNFKSQPVHPPPSPFDETVEMVVETLQKSPYGLVILVVVTMVLFSGILYLVCQESKTLADEQKKTN